MTSGSESVYLIILMKKIFLSLISLLVLTSCEKDPFDEFLKQDSYSPKEGMIWDMSPIEFILEVTDAQGHNMFDKATPNNWLSEPFTATFDGTEFKWPTTETRAYFATLKGFYIWPSWYTKSDVVYLRFGELDGTKKWDNDLCIFWPDGSKDKIRVQHAMRWNQDGYPEYYTAFKVNKVPVDGWLIHLTK